MWQEARKQEKKLRCIMIDYKKRAERRQAYYARMRMDPHQLMRVYGQKCKFHIVADNAKINNTDGQLMPWQGDPEILIDRFDVRAHLDFIPDAKKSDEIELTAEEEKFQRKCNYERYRTLVQIDATGASEEQYLKQLELEEGVGRMDIENKRRMENDKMTSKANAKFHYKYEESDILEKEDNSSDDKNDSDDDGDLSDIDINVNVLDLTEEQTNHLDALATQYGVGYGQYCKQLLLEKKEFEYVKKLEEEEEERAKMPGRKGKSARRSLREKQKTLRGSPLSFALQETIVPEEERTKREGSTSSESSSHSKTPVETKVEFITSFGGDDENNKNGSENILPISEPQRKSDHSHSHRKHSRRRSRSRSRGKNNSSRDHKSRNRHKSRSQSRSRSREREHRRSHHHSSSKTYDRSKSSHSRHSSRGSRNKTDSFSERSNSAHSNTHRSRSRSPKNYSSYKSRSRSPKHDEDSYRSRRDSNEKSRDRSYKRSRSRSISKSCTESKEISRRRSNSKSRSKSRSKSPHETIVKRLGTDSVQTPVVDKSNLTPREKMKLRMQKLLNRQIKSDKKEEHKKQVAKEQEIEERDMEIYEMSRMLRMKEREKRIYRSPSPKDRMPSYDASRLRYVREKDDTPE